MAVDHGPKVIIALDFDNKREVEQLVEQLDPSRCRLKVGKQLFTHFGPELVKSLVNDGYDVFLDLKFHDIPNTVAKACLAAADLGVWMLNVHASGGEKMMFHTKQTLMNAGFDHMKLIAVTVLTSMDQQQLDGVIGGRTIVDQVQRLATLTHQSGLDGIVCSAQEANMIRRTIEKPFDLVTPGIRPAGTSTDDQQRIVTPSDAMHFGVDYMVIGRPITKADNPLKALIDINKEITAAL